jgi:hypothetical protein
MQSRIRGSEGRLGRQSAFAGHLCDAFLSARSRAVGKASVMQWACRQAAGGIRVRARLHVMYVHMEVADLEDSLARDEAEYFVVLFTSHVREVRGGRYYCLDSYFSTRRDVSCSLCETMVSQYETLFTMPVSFQTLNVRCIELTKTSSKVRGNLCCCISLGIWTTIL